MRFSNPPKSSPWDNPHFGPPPCYTLESADDVYRPILDLCFEYFNGPMVYWNGDVGICGCRDVDGKELIIGNLKNSNIKDIWYNSKHLDYLNNFIKRTPEICKTCTHYDNISIYQNNDWKEKIKQHKNIY